MRYGSYVESASGSSRFCDAHPKLRERRTSESVQLDNTDPATTAANPTSFPACLMVTSVVSKSSQPESSTCCTSPYQYHSSMRQLVLSRLSGSTARSVMFTVSAPEQAMKWKSAWFAAAIAEMDCDCPG